MIEDIARPLWVSRTPERRRRVITKRRRRPTTPFPLLLVGLVLLLLVALDVLAPRLRPDRSLRLPDDVELAVLRDLSDEHRLPQVMVLLVHLDLEAVGRHELLACHCCDHFVGVG